MSIFKSTLSQTIQSQLQARTNVVSGVNNNRSNLLPWYLSKNSWVRMTSMVNYTSGIVDPNEGTGNVKVKPDGHYVGIDLAKKNILEGGQLYVRNNNGKDIPSLRKGIAIKNGAYGGDFDLTATSKTNSNGYTRQFGIRPMPGITSVNLHTVSAYGSLFETTINFYAWDNHQLNELEILFMRPGYSVLLEWGWSQYINNNNIPTVFSGLTVPAFSNLTQQDIYDKIEALRIQHDHNYDGMLGYVKNFSWKMLKGGGYECSTTLISMGEVLNSLKISTNNIKIYDKDQTNLFKAESKDNYVYDDFENIFISLKGEGELFSTIDDGDEFISEDEYRGKWNYDANYISRDKIGEKLKSKGYSGEITNRLFQQPFRKSLKSNSDNAYPLGKYYEYISLDTFVAIIDSYFNLEITSKKDETSKIPMVKIIPPGNEDYCLASKDSISVDPSICLVENPLAFREEFVEGLNPTYETNKTGVSIPITYVLKRENGSNYYYATNTRAYPFYDNGLKVGKIGNILVNIDLLLNEYKNIKNSSDNEGVNLVVYFKNILNKISNALGGLNNFSLSTAGRDQNTLRIIDLYYLEKDSNKYEFDLMGLNSIVRDATVESKIFAEQSTIVAIAAQSRANLGDIYNSTQVYLNAGIEDRVALTKSQPEENTDTLQGNPDDPFYAKLFKFLVYVRENVVGADANDDYAIFTNNSGTVPSTFLKQFMLKYNGELNFKALLPFKLNIKLDGIGGIVVGEIFKVKKDILPKNYADKNLGFIITKISHDLQNNDWETTLETQICLLDAVTLGENFIKTNRKGFLEKVEEFKLYGLIYVIARQFVRYQAYRSMIGFMWLSNNEKTIEEGFDYLGYDYQKLATNSSHIQPGDDIDVINKIWKPNVMSMLLGSQKADLDPVNTRNEVSWFNIEQFKDYVRYWIIAYKAKYKNELNNIVVDKTTLLDSLNKLEKEFNDPNSSFNPIIDTVQSFIIENYEKVYTPDDINSNSLTILPYNNYPLFLNVPGLSSRNYQVTTFVTNQYNATLGIDINKLDDNIRTYFSKNDKLNELQKQYYSFIQKTPLAKGTAIQDDPLLYVIPPSVNCTYTVSNVQTGTEISNLKVNKTIYNGFLKTINYINVSNSSIVIRNEYKDLLRGKPLEFIK
jgi:hypothetical protein